jgi:hypothetical protein
VEGFFHISVLSIVGLQGVLSCKMMNSINMPKYFGQVANEVFQGSFVQRIDQLPQKVALDFQGSFFIGFRMSGVEIELNAFDIVQILL